MPPKRMHTKSRNGCMTCRRRRVKCDEIRPICTNCTRRELDCVYAAYCPPGRPGISRSPPSPPASSSSFSSSNSPPPPSQALSPRLRTLPLPPPLQQPDTPALAGSRRTNSTNSPVAALARQFDLLLLEAHARSPSPLPRISLSIGDLGNLSLLHHYTIRTYNALTNDRSVEDIYRARFPRIALQNELAMHSLLAVTALHRSKTAETPLIASRFQTIAASYYDRALSSLRVAVLDPSQDATALLAAAAMIAFYGLGCHTSSGPWHTPRVLTWVPLVKGVHAIIIQWYAQVYQGPLRPLLEQGVDRILEDGDFLLLPPSLFDLALETPPTSNIPHSGDDEIVDAHAASVYKTALNELKRVWGNFWGTGYQVSTCMQWLGLTPEEYFLYVRQGRPRALVIFCHYLCMVKKLDGFWWIKGSAQETFDAIEWRLSSRWRERWLVWPKSIIMGDCEVVGEPFWEYEK